MRYLNKVMLYIYLKIKHYVREDYKVSYAHNKWFWGNGSDLDLSYDISESNWEKIKLTGWNVGQLVPNYRNFQDINPNKSIDICGIFQAKHDYNEDHRSRNDHLYTTHRKGLWDKLEPLKSKYNMIYDRLPFEEYIRNLWVQNIIFHLGWVRFVLEILNVCNMELFLLNQIKIL